MSDFSLVLLTTAGRNVRARCELGEQLVYKRVAVGSGQINTDSEAMARTSLVNELHSVPIYDLEFLGDGIASLKFAFANSGVTDAFYLREIGIYVQDLDNPSSEVLYAITYAATIPDHIPAESFAPVVIKRTLNIYIGNAANVTAVFGNLEIIGVKVLKHFTASVDANGNSLLTLPWNWNPQLDNLTVHVDGVLQSRSGGQWGPPSGQEYSTSCNQVQFTAALSGVTNGVMFVSLPLDGAMDNTTLTNHMADFENPHQVNKAQAGLGAVDNVKQVPFSEKGLAGGVATLDSSGKIPTGQVPDSVLGKVEYKGVWNAKNNYPALTANGTGGVKGDYYHVSVKGTNYVDGTDEWAVGDWIIHNGTVWEKVDNTESTGVKVIVKTQADFDAVFNGSTLGGVIVYLRKKDDGAYLLNNNAPFGSDLIIDGDPGAVIQRGGYYRFTSTGTVEVPVENIHFTPNWLFDGNGGWNVDYGGDITMTEGGGFALLDYVKNSVFECHVTNCKTHYHGSAYYAANSSVSANNSIRNVHVNRSERSGAIYGIEYAKLENVTANYSVEDGGGICSCKCCKITNVARNISGANGGGISDTSNSDITNVFLNSATGSGGGINGGIDNKTSNVYGNIATVSGGGCYQCERSTIDIVSGNNAQVGGGCYECKDCTITNVSKNTSSTNGGGCSHCEDCTISNVTENTASRNGGGLAECISCSITNVHKNTATSENGGGCYKCNNGTIANVRENTAAYGTAGGLYQCDGNSITGYVYGNTASGFADASECFSFVRVIRNLSNNYVINDNPSVGAGW